MKKHDEGYAMVLVVVVIAVLGLIVTPSVLRGAAANMESQRDSVDRMVAKYEAQGQIEMIVAELEHIQGKQSLQEKISQYPSGTVKVLENGSYELTLTKKQSGVTIQCTLLLTAQEDDNYITVKYESYDISMSDTSNNGGSNG